ncbi:winged helix DNA-binding domain-containing protein [Suhomyces tanzawaensis NRRL Y-17324]|uniref:Winged helix DNA-binding domain-containing protein n=1 Tax=Suhomyces tanzawaensis NRRL Y-17324 TaxID=984487 RepID=A0A1E4SGP8_9ASCO|nr:winged helix DNA-binding domain-containing protein [Suhomyces tanzawaensis NRRL Y-17324]ODV78681.1 winged helix DNA-binding domain-containing protein [Suhomyces tanzawaensis NRRL Y-17324]
MSTAFSFPKIHSFPPLYTKQPNATIAQHQLESWTQIVLEYCAHYKITSLSLAGVPRYSQDQSLDLDTLPPIFDNKEIERTVNEEFKTTIINHLIHKLHKADYINPKNPSLGIFIYWRSLTEWSDLLYSYVDKSGQLGTILTIYELTKLEDAGIPDNLKYLDEELLIKVLKEVLIKKGKAQILMNEDGEIGGVKIV